MSAHRDCSALVVCGRVVEGVGACVLCMRVTVGMVEGEVGHYSQELGKHRCNTVEGAVCNAPQRLVSRLRRTEQSDSLPRAAGLLARKLL